MCRFGADQARASGCEGPGASGLFSAALPGAESCACIQAQTDIMRKSSTRRCPPMRPRTSSLGSGRPHEIDTLNRARCGATLQAAGSFVGWLCLAMSRVEFSSQGPQTGGRQGRLVLPEQGLACPAQDLPSTRRALSGYATRVHPARRRATRQGAVYVCTYIQALCLPACRFASQPPPGRSPVGHLSACLLLSVCLSARDVSSLHARCRDGCDHPAALACHTES